MGILLLLVILGWCGVWVDTRQNSCRFEVLARFPGLGCTFRFVNFGVLLLVCDYLGLSLGGSMFFEFGFGGLGGFGWVYV